MLSNGVERKREWEATGQVVMGRNVEGVSLIKLSKFFMQTMIYTVPVS